MKKRTPMLSGEAQLRSPWFSNNWTLTQGGIQVAQIKRLSRIYVSVVDLASYGRIMIEPHGDGVVTATDEDGDILATITRRSWIGRLWDVKGEAYNFELRSDPRPRRWQLEVANAPVSTITGSLISYNTVDVSSGMAVPVPAILLAWHVIARPWEAAAEPRGLVAVAKPG